MWDTAVRWSFGPHSKGKQGSDEKENNASTLPTQSSKRRKTTDTHVFTAPTLDQARVVPFLLASKGKSDAAAPVVSRTSISGTTPPPTRQPLATSSPEMSSPSNSSSSISSPPSSPLAGSSGGELTTPSTLATTTTIPGSAIHDIDRSIDHQRNPITMSSVSTPIYPDPDPVAEAFLEPVKVQLKKLRLSTASAAPPPNMSAHFRIKSHLQLVRERLEPVGSFIVRETKGDGKLEMRVCHYIAKHHWPLPTPPGEATHLRIHEMYRNTLYKRAQLALHPPLAVQYEPRPSMLPPPPSSHDDEEDWPDAMPALEPSTSLGKSVKNKFTILSRKVTSTFHKSSLSTTQEAQDDDGEVEKFEDIRTATNDDEDEID